MVPFLLVAGLGVLVGIGELISRYRDAPFRALRSVPAAVYCGLNGAAALVTLALVQGFDVRFGLEPSSAALPWTRILASGFGALAVLRTSVFTVRAGDQDIGIGPSSLLQVVLTAADRAVDRLRAKARAEEVVRTMKKVSFDKSHQALPAFCIALMQNLPKEDQEVLAQEVTALAQADIAEEIKVLILGLALMNAVGPEVVTTAVDSLGERIKGDKGD